jgi:hypothetical protein
LSQDLPELPGLSPEEVRSFRQSLGMSQDQFGRTFGISRKGVIRQEQDGAPGVYRYAFAAYNAGLKPWFGGRSVAGIAIPGQPGTIHYPDRKVHPYRAMVEAAISRISGKPVTHFTMSPETYGSLLHEMAGVYTAWSSHTVNGRPHAYGNIPIEISSFVGDGGMGALHYLNDQGEPAFQIISPF